MKSPSINLTPYNMPYNISKEHGGDSAGNDKKMEECVNMIMKKGMKKESAIKMCKSKMFPMKKMM